MKRNTPKHPKMYALAEALRIPLAHAVGIMEMLWHHAAQHTPQGELGSIPDAAIAGAVGWKKPAQLVDALVQSRWVDCNPEHRLVIHDWPEHCEQAVVKVLEYNHKDFLPIYGVSLENRKRSSRKSLPSRVAMAKGLGSEVVSKTKNQEVSELWTAAGFESPEDFGSWWSQVVSNHPNKNRNTNAFAAIQELIIRGQFKRSEFEEGYSQLREAKEDDWTKEGGKFCTNLYDIIHDQLWKFKPSVTEKWITDLVEEQALEGRQHA